MPTTRTYGMLSIAQARKVNDCEFCVENEVEDPTIKPGEVYLGRITSYATKTEGKRFYRVYRYHSNCLFKWLYLQWEHKGSPGRPKLPFESEQMERRRTLLIYVSRDLKHLDRANTFEHFKSTLTTLANRYIELELITPDQSYTRNMVKRLNIGVKTFDADLNDRILASVERETVVLHGSKKDGIADSVTKPIIPASYVKVFLDNFLSPAEREAATARIKAEISARNALIGPSGEDEPGSAEDEAGNLLEGGLSAAEQPGVQAVRTIYGGRRLVGTHSARIRRGLAEAKLEDQEDKEIE